MDYKENQRGKCETCGFLSKHARFSSAPPPRFYEIIPKDRREPETYSQQINFGVPGTVHTDLACFIRKANLSREIHAARTGISDRTQQNERMYDVVRKDRKCDGWFPYLEGFDPVEHFRWYQDQQREKARQDYEARMEADRRSYERDMAQRSEDDRRLFEGNLEAARETREGRDRALLIVGLLLTGAGVLLAAAQIIAAIIFSMRESYTDRLLKSIFG